VIDFEANREAPCSCLSLRIRMFLEATQERTYTNRGCVFYNVLYYQRSSAKARDTVQRCKGEMMQHAFPTRLPQVPVRVVRNVVLATLETCMRSRAAMHVPVVEAENSGQA
jgi:hypothetical protein